MFTLYHMYAELHDIKEIGGKNKTNKEIKILSHHWYSRRGEAENIKSTWIYFQSTLHELNRGRIAYVYKTDKL